MSSLPLVRLLGAAGLFTLLGCTPENWNEEYRVQGKNPYDLYVLYELLEAREPGVSRLADTADLRQLAGVTGTNYLFAGHRPYYDARAVTRLLDYVERGNTAFLAAGEVPEDLALQLFGPGCYTDNFLPDDDRFPVVWADSVVALRYPRPDSFPLVNVRYWQAASVPLRVIGDGLLCDPAFDVEVVGSLDTLGVNFLRVGWGSGNFYLYTTPRFLTNWYLLDSVSAPYPATVLSVLDTGRVYWDEYHRRYQTDPAATAGSEAATERNYTGGRNLLTGNPTLRYIQERRELALAWYLVLAGAVLFVLFRGKRRQRVIPVLPDRPNDSRRLIDTISRLVQQKGDHAALIRRELQSLRFHLTHHRGIGWREGEPAPPDLAERLGLAREIVDRALTEIDRAERSRRRPRERDLLRLYRAIDPLYR